MLVTISVATYNRSKMTKKFLECLRRTNPPSDTELIFSDNGSTDETIHLLETFELPNKRIIRYGYNTGFSYPHNRALQIATGEYFVVLNNDFLIFSEDWLSILLGPLKQDDDVAIVGLEGTPSTILRDGCVKIGTQVDYVEASCLAGRTQLFKQFGLFSPALKMFCFEDVDLSLRYRQMGYKVQLVPVRHHHHTSTTYWTLNSDFRLRILQQNRVLFLNRWQNYLETRRFTNRILLKTLSDRSTDVLYITSVLKGIRQDHPSAEIDVSTNWSEIFEGNPYINKISPFPYNKHNDYDRLIDFNISRESLDPPVRQYERIAATEAQFNSPELYLTAKEQQDARETLSTLRKRFDLVVVCSFQTNRMGWDGINWSLEHARELFFGLRSLTRPSVAIVEVGKDVHSTGQADLDLVGMSTIRQLAALISQADAFIGIDSFPSHIAQALGIRSYILFGATEPISRVINFSKTVGIRCNHSECLGCFHKKGFPLHSNSCLLGDESCMRELDAAMVLEQFILNKQKLNSKGMDYLHGILPRLLEETPLGASVNDPILEQREYFLLNLSDLLKQFWKNHMNVHDIAFVLGKLITAFVKKLTRNLRS